MLKRSETRQLFWYSLANYIAIFIGFLSVIFVFPNNLEFLGKVKYIETIGYLFHPFLLFGLAQSLVNFFPVLETYHVKTYFGNAIIFIAVMAIIAFGLLFIIHYFYQLENFNYYLLGLLVAVSLAYIELLKCQSITIKKSVIPVFLEKIVPRIILLSLFYLLLKNTLTEAFLLKLFSCSYYSIVVLMFMYVLRFTTPRFSLKPEYLFENFSISEFFNFSFLAFIGGLGSLIAFRIDSYMIPQFLTMKDNGIYSIVILLASLIAVPSTAVFALNAPEISRLLKDNKIDELGIKYQESAKLLFFLGSLLFSCFIVSMDDFFMLFFPKLYKFYEMSSILIILGLNNLINMGTGFNNEIIIYSKYFRFNIITILILVILNIFLNYYFLSATTLKLTGVAIATSISMSLYNIIKLVFIYKKFRILPFSKKYLYIALIISAITSITYILPSLHNHWQNIFYKAGIILVFNSFLIYYFSLIKRIKTS